MLITGGGEIELQNLNEDEARHLCIGNAVNRTYTSPYDPDNDEPTKKKKKASKTKQKDDIIETEVSLLFTFEYSVSKTSFYQND